MADWQPDPDGLARVVDLATSALNPANYQNTINSLMEYNQIPDFNNYLCYAFVYLDEPAANTRMMLAIMLKDNVARFWKTLGGEVKQYIMANLPNMLAHPVQALRDACGGVITVILAQTKIEGWPDLVQNLVAALDDTNPHMVQGAFFTLRIICEDHGRELCQAHRGLPHLPSDIIVPKLLQLLSSGREDLLNLSLKCFVYLIPWKPPFLLLHIKEFFGVLFGLAENPPSLEILVSVCKTFDALVWGRVSAIKEYMNDVIVYMLTMTNSEHDAVALVAGNFWSTIADTEICAEVVGPHLPQVVETLLMHMRITDAELESMCDVEEDIMTPDNPENTTPVVGKITMGDDVNASYDMNMSVSEWTLRKACGRGLEELTYVFDEEILEVIIPLCEAGLQSAEWRDREASVLALGATSACFLQSGDEHLPGLIPLLISILDDAWPLIRHTAAWTIARYSKWIVEQNDMLQPTIDALSRRLRDRSKKVLEYSLQSLAIVAEAAQEQMRDYVEDLLPVYMDLYNHLQGKLNNKVLDALGALCEAVGEALNQPHLLEMLMTPILARWEAIDDADERIFNLFDCVTRISLALRASFAPYVSHFWYRASNMIQNYLIAVAMAKENPSLDDPNSRFMESSMELMSSIVEGLKAGSADLIAETNLIAQLVEVLNLTTSNNVLRAALCLVGDIASSCFPMLAPALPSIMNIMVANIRPRATHISLLLNASWAVKEIALRTGPELSEYAPEIIRRCINIMHDPQQRAQAHHNAAILLGVIASSFSQIAATDLENFIEPWCIILASLEEDDEKKISFFGLLETVKVNPEAVLPHFHAFAHAVASWSLPPTSLIPHFTDIFRAYQEQLGPDIWDNIMKTVNEEDHVVLQQWYL